MKNKKYLILLFIFLIFGLIGCDFFNIISEEEFNKVEKYKIGERGPAGGYIFYDKGSYSDGWRYLEAAPESAEFSAKWSDSSSFIGGTGTAIGDGKSNTEKIVTWSNKNSETSNAAIICNNLVFGGYDDWFLPSRDELEKMYENIKEIGDFSTSAYWSSYDYNDNEADYLLFMNGSSNSFDKRFSYKVRAARYVGTTTTTLPPSSSTTTTLISNGYEVTTFSGTNKCNYINGDKFEARFNEPWGCAFNNNYIYVLDKYLGFGEGSIRKIDMLGNVSDFVSNLNSTQEDLCTDNNGNLYIFDYNKIKKISSLGVVSDFSESGVDYITFDKKNNIFYVSDDNRIKKITSTGDVTTLAGDLWPGYVDGQGTDARFSWPCGLTVDNIGNIYVADSNNNVIRKITPYGEVSTFCGTGDQGYIDGINSCAEFNQPSCIVIDNSGNFIISDSGTLIRMITPDGTVFTIAGKDENGYKDGFGDEALFGWIVGLTIDDNNNIYVSDHNNYCIRKITKK